MCALTTIVFSGGANYAGAFFGALRYLEHTSLSKGVRKVVGSSAGSLIALWFALGLTSDEMSLFTTELIEKHRFNCISIDNVVNVMDTFGMDDGSNIDTALNLTLSKYANRDDMTFKTLAQTTGVDLVICALNLTQKRFEYMSLETTPNMSVKTAARMSMSLPLIFKPVKYRKCYYVDPLFGRNFPFDFPGHSSQPPRSILGLNLSTLKCKDSINERMNFASYILSLMSVILSNSNPSTGTSNSNSSNSNSNSNSLMKTSGQEKEMFNMILVTIEVDLEGVSFDANKMQFTWSKEVASELSRKGYKAVESNDDISRIILETLKSEVTTSQFVQIS